MIEHLERAERLTKEINDPMADYMINMALMTVGESDGPKTTCVTYLQGLDFVPNALMTT
jgi:hypothetical protein